MNKNFKSLFFLTILLLSLGLGASSRAGDIGPIKIENPIGDKTLQDIIYSVMDFIYNVALALVPFAVVWSGLMYVTSEGNPVKIENAKKIIYYSLIGLLLILFSKGLSRIFTDLLKGEL